MNTIIKMEGTTDTIAMWMTLQSIMLDERSQTTCWMVPSIGHPEKHKAIGIERRSLF